MLLAEFTGWELDTLGRMTEPELLGWHETMVKIAELREKSNAG